MANLIKLQQNLHYFLGISALTDLLRTGAGGILAIAKIGQGHSGLEVFKIFRALRPNGRAPRPMASVASGKFEVVIIFL